MKRIAAILLMGILFFNWYGYRLLSAWLEERADRQLEARLDTDSYDESQLISIKVPSSHLSYYNSSTEFERVDGQIELNGVQYKYVKRRLFNDSLEMLCLPNHTAMGLTAARNDFFKLVNDLQVHNGQEKKSDSHPGAAKSVIVMDYDVHHPCIMTGDRSFTFLPKALSYDVLLITSSYVLTAEQPPDLSSSHC